MVPALVIAAKDLRQRVRDRSAIVLAFVAPVAVAALMSAAFAGVEHVHATVALADADHGPAASELAAALETRALQEIVTVHELPSAAAVQTAVRDGAAGAGIVVPPGFTASLGERTPKPLTIVSSVNDATAATLARAVVDRFTAELDADRLAVATAIAAGAPRADAASLAATAGRIPPPVVAVPVPVGARQLEAISYFAPAMAIFFVLFVVSFTSRSYFVERDEGMVDRILAAPVRPGSLVAGKALSAFVFAGLSMGVMVLCTGVFFGADWGAPLPAALVVLAMVLSVVALSALVIVFARSERQADMVASIVVFGLALLGGNFVLVSVEPPLMRTLALATPNGWALRAFTDLATTSGGVGTVLVPLLAILAFATVCGGLAMGLARRLTRR